MSSRKLWTLRLNDVAQDMQIASPIDLIEVTIALMVTKDGYRWNFVVWVREKRLDFDDEQWIEKYIFVREIE